MVSAKQTISKIRFPPLRPFLPCLDPVLLPLFCRDRMTAQNNFAEQRKQPPSTTPWLTEEIYFQGYRCPRWYCCAGLVLIFLCGPASIGFIILAGILYLVYKTFYLEGHTPQSLWKYCYLVLLFYYLVYKTFYQDLAEQHQTEKKNKKKKNTTKNKQFS